MSANTHSLDLEASSAQFIYRDRTSSPNLDITGDICIEAWVNLESPGGTIISKWGTAGQRAYKLEAIDAGSGVVRPRLTISSDGTTDVNSTDTSIDLQTSVWHHLAVSYDASAGSAIYFLDGVQKGTFSSYPTSIYNAAFNTYMGAQGGGTYLDGKIDEIRVWNTTRTEAQIAANYNQELVGNESGLVLYLQLDNNYDDTSSSNYDADVSGTPVFSTSRPFEGTSTSTSSSTSTTTTSTSTSTTSTSRTTSTSTTSTVTSTSTTTTSTSTSTSTTSSSTSTTTTLTSTTTTIDLKFSVEKI